MKVLLIIPPKVNDQWVVREDKYNGESTSAVTPYTPIILYSLIKRELPFIDLKLIEAQRDGIGFEETVIRVKKFDPELIITYMSWCHIPEDRKVAELPYPTIAIILQQTIDRKEAIRLYDLQSKFICKNEIEYPIVHALKEFHETNKIISTKGFLINDSGKYIDTGDAPLADLSELPIPDFDTFEYEKYFRLRTKSAEIGDGIQYLAMLNTMKGCLFNCIYCGQARKNQKARFQTSDQVYEQIRILVGRYKVRHINFIDNEFGVNLKRAKEICRKIIKNELDFTWQVNNRVELFDDELIRLMAEAGCTNVRLGIETCDPTLQKFINKNIDLDQAKNTISKIKDVGITIHLYFIIGIPGETKDTLKMNARFISAVEPNSFSSTPLFLMPNSIFYQSLKTQNKIIIQDWAEYKTPDKLVFQNESYSKFEEIVKAQNYVNKHIYLRLFFKLPLSPRKHFLYALLFFCSTTTWQVLRPMVPKKLLELLPRMLIYDS